MEIKFWLNGKMIKDEIEPDILLLEYVRSKGCYSVVKLQTVVYVQFG